MNTSNFTLEQFIQAVKEWREDVGKDGKWPKSSYPMFSSTPLAVFDPVCDTLNAQWEQQDSGFRVGYSMGDFRAYFKDQRELF